MGQRPVQYCVKSWFVAKPDMSPVRFPAKFHMDDHGVYLRFGFRLAVVIGIWLMPTPMPPRTFGGYFPRAFSAAAFVLNGFEILLG
jgi:hypothetical protein